MGDPPPPTTSNCTLSDQQGSTTLVVISSISSSLVVLLLLLGFYFGLRYRKLFRLSKLISNSEIEEFLNGGASANTERETDSIGWVERLKSDFELSRSDFVIDFETILGSGLFATVCKGLVKEFPAAIKRPNRDCSRTSFRNALIEVKVLSHIGYHPNVVGFIGAYIKEIQNGVLYIATELCSSGSLESYLTAAANQNQNNTELEASAVNFHELHRFAKEIAQGMEYIESKRVIHRQLSTRKVLLDDYMICKIGGFGLSRKLDECEEFVEESQIPLPWKLMAPESINKMIFTTKSDVWGYGVTLWEIYSYGKVPYAGICWSPDFVNELKTGLRLPSPDFASEEIYGKMLECWNLIPDERPTFTDMANYFESLSESAYTILV